MLSLTNDGFVILLGSYNLIHIKIIWYYAIGCLGGIWGYFLDNKKRNKKTTLKGVVFTIFSTIMTIYLVVGALEYVFDVTKHGYIFFIAGYFSKNINLWIETHAEEIVDKISKKILVKTTDINIDNKKDKGQNNNEK